MAQQLAHRRILLKLSGELLKGPEGGIDPDAASGVAGAVKDVVELGVETALVIGAGNIFRGLAASRSGMNRCRADYMGMLATVINALAMQDALEAAGIQACIQSAIPMPGIADPFDLRIALDQLTSGSVVIFAAGTGHPYFTTDTTAALRACQIQADAILKATRVDGVYSADPASNPGARRFTRISYSEALSRRLRVMDSTAFCLCMDNHVPVVVFRFADPGVLPRIVQGDLRSGTLVHDGDTLVDPNSADG